MVAGRHLAVMSPRTSLQECFLFVFQNHYALKRYCSDFNKKSVKVDVKSRDLFPFYVILLHVPHDSVNNPSRKVFLGLTCFSFCSLLINFYYLGSVLLSHLHELLRSRFHQWNHFLNHYSQRQAQVSSHFRVFLSLLRCLKRTSAAVVFFWPAVTLSHHHLLCSCKI